ncbi:hypothetical protein Leryth_003878 [Lithospermum erythrorhizon]|nr:hypothetical protein Leryth_003878 [Lithospermum erythrorhizon]
MTIDFFRFNERSYDNELKTKTKKKKTVIILDSCSSSPSPETGNIPGPLRFSFFRFRKSSSSFPGLNVQEELSNSSFEISASVNANSAANERSR